MLTVTCPKCHTTHRVPDSRAGRYVTCEDCGKSFTVPSPGLIRAYADWCGRRSLIFQALFIAWTAFMLCVWFGMMLLAAGGKQPVTDAERHAHATVFALMGLCCPLGMYLLLAIPLFFGVLLTLGKDRR